MDKGKFELFLEDIQKVVKSIPSIVEDSENATIIITWIEKMLIKLEENLKKIEEIKSKAE